MTSRQQPVSSFPRPSGETNRGVEHDKSRHFTDSGGSDVHRPHFARE